MDSMELLHKPMALYTPKRAEGEVFYIDRFGNAVTSLEGKSLESVGLTGNARVECGGRRIPLVKTFGQVAPGDPLAYIGSGGRLEIAINGGSVQKILKLRIDSKITVIPSS